jgi:hypothetical protein
VLSADAVGSHVQWVTGARAGNVTLIPNEDIAAQGSSRTAVHDELDESLEYGSLVSIAVRDVYDIDGETGVVEAMNEAGHLASLARFAEEAVSVVAAQVRTSPAFEAVLSQLEPEEADAIVTTAAASLLRDALGE